MPQKSFDAAQFPTTVHSLLEPFKEVKANARRVEFVSELLLLQPCSSCYSCCCLPFAFQSISNPDQLGWIIQPLHFLWSQSLSDQFLGILPIAWTLIFFSVCSLEMANSEAGIHSQFHSMADDGTGGEWMKRDEFWSGWSITWRWGWNSESTDKLTGNRPVPATDLIHTTASTYWLNPWLALTCTTDVDSDFWLHF